MRFGYPTVAFGPNGETILSSGCSERSGRTCIRGEVRLWDVRIGETLQIFEGYTGEVYSVVYAPDGTRFASSNGDNTVRIWGIPSE